jgi:hypothetical protein
MNGQHIDVQDARAADLGRRARLGGQHPMALLRDPSIMGSLARDSVVHRDVARALADIDNLGPSGAVRAALPETQGDVIPLGRGRELAVAAEIVNATSAGDGGAAVEQSGSVA